MFELTIPQSLADLPGRVHICGDDEELPPKTHAERMAQMKAAQEARSRENKRRLDRLSYARHRKDILARKRARYAQRKGA